MRLLTGLVPALVLITASALQAQEADAIVGKWTIEFERGRRIENGVPSPIMGKGSLVVTKEGEGFKAVLDAGARPDGTPAPIVTMSGSAVEGGGVLFVQKSKAQMNMNGEVQEMEITTKWTLIPSAESLRGELVREVPNVPDAGGPSPVTGMRVK